MFSVRQKREIAKKVEDLLLSYFHPEMPTEKPIFRLHIQGKEEWSYADIDPNWVYDDKNPPSVNPWNEEQDREAK